MVRRAFVIALLLSACAPAREVDVRRERMRDAARQQPADDADSKPPRAEDADSKPEGDAAVPPIADADGPTPPAQDAAVPEDAADRPSDADLPSNAETYWLTRIGWGKDQTDKVCARANRDPVALALCAYPSLTSLADLQRAFWPAGRVFGQNYLSATTYHSQSLVGRTVSAVNPRLILTSVERIGTAPVTSLALAFVRGEQFVELLGVDASNRRLNFYLLAFGHACHRAGSCSASDLIGPRVEREWTSWTLYQDEDLEDTGLSCLSCHQPEGPGTPKRFLMRQEILPWMHWGAPLGTAADCADGRHITVSPSSTSNPTVLIDLANSFAQAHANETHYGGEPVGELSQRISGKPFSGMAGSVRRGILLHEGVVDPAEHTEARFPVAEPHPFNSPIVIAQHYCDGRRDYWTEYRDLVLRKNGFPIPYYKFDVMDAMTAAAARADYPTFLQQTGARDPFDVLTSLMSIEAATASGFLPDPETDAPTILQQMCVRCHSGTEPSQLRRARFNARKLDELTPEVKADLIRRITAPRDSHDVMPPRRGGELPDWAIARVVDYLSGR